MKYKPNLSLLILSAVLLTGIVSAATTISTNISTGGELSVTGTSTLMGNVGIGTTSPFARLSVAGSGSSGGTAFAVSDIASTTRFVVLDNGGVGIGTTTPSRQLTINNNSSTAYATVRSSNTGIAGLLLGDQAADYQGRVSYDNQNEMLSLWANGNQYFTVKGSNGYVGLGSATSSSDLTVDMTIRPYANNTASRFYIMPHGTPSAGLQSGIKMFGTDFLTDATNYNDFGLWAGSDYNYINSKQNGSGTAKDFLFSYNDGSATGGLDLMVIKTSGNVGIGTTTPTTQLQIATSTSNATTTLTVGKTGQNKGSCLEMFDSTGTVKYVSINNNTLTVSDTSCK